MQRTLTLTSSPRVELPARNDEEGPAIIKVKEETQIIEEVGSDIAVPNAVSHNSVPSQKPSCAPEETNGRKASSKVKWVFSPERALQKFKSSRQLSNNPRGTKYVMYVCMYEWFYNAGKTE